VLSPFENGVIEQLVQASQMTNMPAYYLPNNSKLMEGIATVLTERLNDDAFMSFFNNEVCPTVL
jgi:hypothetical protein